MPRVNTDQTIGSHYDVFRFMYVGDGLFRPREAALRAFAAIWASDDRRRVDLVRRGSTICWRRVCPGYIRFSKAVDGVRYADFINGYNVAGWLRADAGLASVSKRRTRSGIPWVTQAILKTPPCGSDHI